MKSIPSFEDAMQLDQVIYQLASYDTTNGMIISVRSEEQLEEYKKSVAKKFNLFKRLLQNNEMSFSDLQNMVISRSGPFPSKKHNCTSEEYIAEVVEAVINKSNKPDIEAESQFVETSANKAVKKLIEDIFYNDTYNRSNSNIIEGSVEDAETNGITIEGLFSKGYKKPEKPNEKIIKKQRKTKKPKKN